MPERVLIIIPAFNEGGRVGPVVRGCLAAVPSADVLVVDDGSRDNTRAEARAAGAKVLKLPVNMGYGVALQTGYKYAVRNGYEIIGQIDGDGQHRPSDLPELLTALTSSGTDVVVGSRFLSNDGHYNAPQGAQRGHRAVRPPGDRASRAST